MSSQESIVKELYNQYSNDILNYSMSLLKDSDDAKDALQEVFVRFINSHKSFRGECSYKTYLLVITRNYCYKKLNGRAGRIIPIDEALIHPFDSKLDEKITLNDAMKSLNREDFEIIYLREFACHSYQEIADILGISIDNTKVKLFRVREQLRKYLR